MSNEILPAGAYQGRATGADIGETKSGNEQVVVQFTLTQPAEYAGRTLNWYGFFTGKTVDRTVESLRICGWHGIDLSDLSGVDANEVQLVVEHESYEGVTTAKVRWVNALGGMLKKPLDPIARKTFAQRMRGAVAAADAKNKAKNGPQTGTAAPSFRSPEPPPLNGSDPSNPDDFPAF